jgi:heme-degrading monooxygenase HmoA
VAVLAYLKMASSGLACVRLAKSRNGGVVSLWRLAAKFTAWRNARRIVAAVMASRTAATQLGGGTAAGLLNRKRRKRSLVGICRQRRWLSS